MTIDPFAPISGGASPAPAPVAPASVPAWLPVLPVPPSAPNPPKEHPTKGRPSAVWTYRDSAGAVLALVARFEKPDGGKDVLPLTWCRNASGREGWRWAAIPENRPLYGLDRLAQRPASLVIVTEGEKAADAAAALLPDHVATTSSGGGKAAAKSDWSPLAGRAVVIWPDADAPGQAYADEVARLALAAGAISVRVIVPPQGVTKGWDAADAKEEGLNPAKVLDLIRAAKEVAPAPSGNDFAPVDAAMRPAPETAPETAPDSLADTAKQGGRGKRRERKNPPKRDAFLASLDAADLWHSPEKVGFATVPVNGHLEHWRLDSAAFARWAAGQFYRATGNAPAGQMLADALRVLQVRAIEDGPCHKTFLRTAWDGQACWLDLCDDAWRAVRITAGGWEVVARPAVKFLRGETMHALPEPEAGHLIEELRVFINADDGDFRLIVAWLVAALWGRGSAFPVLALGGEQGSGKSTMARLLRGLVDPSAVSGLAQPKDERDLFTMAISSHVLSFDNLSKVENWFSDSVCRLSTGSGFLTRKLHSDAEPFWFAGSRPVLVNGIPSLTGRADMADRSLTVRLLRIDETARQSEDDFWAAWEAVRPGIIGALLDAVAAAVRRYDATKLERAPRMADFARLMAAAEPGLGWMAGEFMAAYEANRRETAEAVFEGDPVAVAIERLMREEHPTGRWEGTATALLAALTRLGAEDATGGKFLPLKPNTLGDAVARAAPLLRAKGIAVEKRRAAGSRTILISWL
ncbi:Superfamily II helicase and inactivated derivatives [Pannonibacter phragmitetus]|uniref:Superfamily II helicase and inactivated derivatives n=1 Tax=Pannonibacter phragmitetus TaxID=121719 RepID=A0A378ZUS1_9HYPH|nr:hypothetical protein [Pannonibacter phragmitetus]SUB00550.1 Superfamily II helicase and inactivated derivatives [Pannonibacter phragmitetus]